MSEQDNLRILDSRIKELWGQVNNYVASENEQHFSILLDFSQGLLSRQMERIRMTSDTANLHECIQDITADLELHHDEGDWEAITDALNHLREALELVEALRK